MSATPRRRSSRLGVVGLALAPVAVLSIIFGAVFAWNLHASNVESAAAQAELRERMADLDPADVPPAATDGGGVEADTTPLADDPRLDTAQAGVDAAQPEPGTGLGDLWFEREGRRFLTDPLIVVHGTDAESLSLGPGHYLGTPLPGEPGNTGIAGHRTTYGAPFGDIDQLDRGDVIALRTDTGTHRYAVRRSAVVDPDDVSVLDADPLGSGRPTLTLTTCHPRHSARQRLIVWAELLPPDAA